MAEYIWFSPDDCPFPDKECSQRNEDHQHSVEELEEAGYWNVNEAATDEVPRQRYGDVTSAEFHEFDVLRDRVRNAVGRMAENAGPTLDAYYRAQLESAISFEDVFVTIVARRLAILIERQRKYGPDNIRNQGIFGVLTRIREDKLSRISMALSGQVVNGRVVLDPIPDGEAGDTFQDGLFDAGNYLDIMEALRMGVWGKPLESDLG